MCSVINNNFAPLLVATYILCIIYVRVQYTHCTMPLFTVYYDVRMNNKTSTVQWTNNGQLLYPMV